MLTIARDFATRSDGVVAFLDIVAAVVTVAKTEHKSARSRVTFVRASKRLKTLAQADAGFYLTAFDGSYLTLCAEYEMTVRNLIEKFVQEASLKCMEYNHLPIEMREWYPDGCSTVILNIGMDKFSHLTKDQIVRSLASCVKVRGFSLLGEPFSDNHMNFRPGVVEDTLAKRIGLRKIWQKLSRAGALQGMVGTTELSTVERQLRDKLECIMQRRNDIIHRGRRYYVPSDTEVREAAAYLKALVTELAAQMQGYLAGI